MSRTRHLATVSIIIIVVVATTSRAALAQDAAPPPSSKSTEKSDDFETSWFGIRPEIWFEPAMSLQAKIGGTQSLGGTTLTFDNTRLDASEDLGVKTHTPKPTYLDFSPGALGLEAFVDTRWVSISAWGVMPFEYHGRRTLSESVSFAGVTFSTTREVETDIAQAIGGLDIKVNIINNRFIRLSPIVAVRAIAVDWTIQDVTPGSPGPRASTEDIDFPLSAGRYKIFPYPEVGGEVRAGYRDFAEADVKVTAMYVNYLGVQAKSALLDGGITGYIPVLPQIGARIGFRYYYLSARTSDQRASKQFDATLRLYGATFSVIVRF